MLEAIASRKNTYEEANPEHEFNAHLKMHVSLSTESQNMAVIKVRKTYPNGSSQSSTRMSPKSFLSGGTLNPVRVDRIEGTVPTLYDLAVSGSAIAETHSKKKMTISIPQGSQSFIYAQSEDSNEPTGLNIHIHRTPNRETLRFQGISEENYASQLTAAQFRDFDNSFPQNELAKISPRGGALNIAIENVFELTQLGYRKSLEVQDVPIRIYGEGNMRAVLEQERIPLGNARVAIRNHLKIIDSAD